MSLRKCLELHMTVVVSGRSWLLVRNWLKMKWMHTSIWKLGMDQSLILKQDHKPMERLQMVLSHLLHFLIAR